MSKRILILSDSLALPRNKPEVCLHHQTWPELLKAKGFCVHQVSIGGATSSDLLTQLNYHISFEPNLAVLQVGIVDCAPRFMTKNELAFFKNFGIVGKAIIAFSNKNIVRRIRNTTYTSPKKFEENISSIIKKLEPIPVLILGIVPAFDEYEKKLPGINKRIVQFNTVLQKFNHYISLQDFDKEGIMSDHHHLNPLGHRIIFDKIINRISILN